jgi:hypothetical protein
MSILNRAILLVGLLVFAVAAYGDGIKRDILTEQNGIRGLITTPAGPFVPPTTCTGANFRLTYNNTCSTVYYMTIH